MTFLQTGIPGMDIIINIWNNVKAAIPNFLGAAGIIIIGWLFASILSKAIKKFIGAIGVDKLADKLNEIDFVSRSKVRIVPSLLFSKAFYYITLLLTIVAATDYLKMEALSNLMTDILNYIPSLVTAVFILAIGIWVSDSLKTVVLTACNSLAIPGAKIISNFVFYFLFINVTMVALSQAQVDTDFIQDNLSIILGGVVLAFAIGYGFASKDIAANILASFYSKNKVQIGDTLTIDGETGQVIDMDNSNIRLQSGANTILFPMSKLSQAKVVIHGKSEG